MAPLGFRGCSITQYLPFLGAFLAISVIATFSYTWPTSSNAIGPYFTQSQSLPEHSEVEEVRQVRIAIEESGGFHEEVFAALIYSALRIPGAEVDFYRNYALRYGFSEILSTYYDKPVKRLDALYDDLSVDEDGSRIDVVISTTCSSRLPVAGKRMMDAYEARQKKFKLLCVIHHAGDMDKMEKDLRPWALKGSLALITLSSHTARTTELNLGWLMARPNGIMGVPYDDCRVVAFIPIFPYDIALHSNLTSLRDEGSPRRLKQVVVQGGIEQGRRDYAYMFTSLETEIRADPKLWGYLIPNNDSAPFTPDPEVPDPFSLALLGQGSREIPETLLHVVQIHNNLPYADFYKLLHSMDLLIPAFRGEGYYTDSASSSLPAAIIAHIPSLVTRMHMNSYTYLDSRSTVLRPSSISAMAAVGLLRKNGFTLSNVNPDDNHLSPWSWPRSEESMKEYRESVYEQNHRALWDAIWGNPREWELRSTC
jgi:hypothetical protein